MVAHFPAPSVPLDDLDRALRDDGYAVLEPASVVALAGVGAGGFDGLLPSWDDLPQDDYLKDGGRYRKRRHASFIAEAGALVQVPPRRHWQPVEYNALHGGMERWFAPVAPATLAQPDWRALLRWLARVADVLQGAQPWYGEAH
nr:2OG-Fe dioxygenase family protein [Pseudoxanthomonas sp.]